MKIGDLVRDEDNDIGVIVEFDLNDFEPQVVVYYAGLTNVMSDEEKYHWMWQDQIEVICEGR